MAVRHKIRVGNEVSIDGSAFKVTKVTVAPKKKGEGFECRIALNRRGRPFTGTGITEQAAVRDAEARVANAVA